MNKLKVIIVSLVFLIPTMVIWFMIWSNWVEENPTTPDDVLIFTWAEVQLYDQSSSEYDEWKRMQVLDLWNTVLDSKLYGEYRISDSGLDIVTNLASDPNCDDAPSYKFEWSFTHDSSSLTSDSNDNWFEDLFIDDSVDNYYCPTTWDFSFSVISDQTGRFVFDWSGNPIQQLSVQVIDWYWNEQIVNLEDLLNNEWIYINGSYLTSSDVESGSFVWELNDDTWNIQLWDSWDLVTSKVSNFNQIINKNVELLTRWKTPETTPTISDLGGKDFYYYNYEWEESTSVSNLWNKWKIVTLASSSNRISNRILEVSWKKALVVKGWNIYINSDIKNNWDDNNILVIVAKRDSTNNKNGWNIYINPDVTNIDAVLVADGSILNFDGNSIVSWDNLKKQLLIYWAVATKNTIGSDDAPYWSDHYIAGQNSSMYNLVKLRNFQAILSDSVDDTSACSSTTWDLVAMWSDNTTAMTDAFAWRKECYISQNRSPRSQWWIWESWLRSTDKVTPVVILYNPIIQTNPPEILKVR